MCGRGGEEQGAEQGQPKEVPWHVLISFVFWPFAGPAALRHVDDYPDA
jgi:hypothetical protein